MAKDKRKETMLTSNFQKLICAVTNRDFKINTSDVEIINGKEYLIYRILPLTGIRVSFKWKAASSDEKILRSFITAFCSKYREPNPKAYDYSAKIYGDRALWVNKTDLEKEHAYYHHASNMYSKAELLKQVELNFNDPEMKNTLLKYGFYPTVYGVGIFAFWATPTVLEAIKEMKQYLTKRNIPFSNEFSDAMWVLRFKIGLTKEAHRVLLNEFN